MALQELSSWLISIYDTILDRVHYTYILITTSELAAVYFLATLLTLYFTIALTVLVDEAITAYKRMPK